MQPFHESATTPPLVLLTIAGLDPSSGAGLTADLQVFAAHGFFGVSCPTLLTVQSTRGVRRTVPVEAELVDEMLACLAEDLPIAGVKLGALGSAAVADAVAGWLRSFLARKPGRTPVVLDPVLRSTGGTPLLDPGALAILRRELLPLVTVVTPNVREAAELAELEPGDGDSLRVPELAHAVLERMGGDRAVAVVVTGGHLQDAPNDYLLQAGEPDGRWFAGEWVRTTATHGTGCAFSSALLCALASNLSLPEAVGAAKQYVRRALETALPLGHGRGPVNHLHGFRQEG